MAEDPIYLTTSDVKISAKSGRFNHNLETENGDKFMATGIPMKNPLPGALPNESYQDYAKRMWDSDPALRVEFDGDYSAWESYCGADAAGQIKILNG